MNSILQSNLQGISDQKGWLKPYILWHYFNDLGVRQSNEFQHQQTSTLTMEQDSNALPWTTYLLNSVGAAKPREFTTPYPSVPMSGSEIRSGERQQILT